MLCGKCGKNQATKTYEQVKNGQRQIEYYCMDCYHRSFLRDLEAEGETSLSACPYCGRTAAEFSATKLVGCAYCYRTMNGAITPMIIKMQGVEAHKGKYPLPENPETAKPGEEKDPKAMAKVKYRRQCNELTLIVEKLRKAGDYDGAKEYADKLSRMKSKSDIEEDFVWRGSLKESKGSKRS